jgi:ABC-type nitrate/sulfonate/bicarbonate transport system ATPase subunit
MTNSNFSPENPLIALRNLGLIYNENSPSAFEALRSVQLDVQEGDFVCVLGASGCGKTSLLRIIAGYEQATSGEVLIDGHSHTKPDAEVGVVFQHPNLFPWLTVRKNVEFGLKMKGMHTLERRRISDHFLDMVGLAAFSDALPHQLSGGMKQRAAIARALAADPKVILMDEPFGALDAITRESMQEHLISIWRKTRKSIFFITHDVEEALLLGTRILVMQSKPGRIVKSIENPFSSDREQVFASRTTMAFAEIKEELLQAIRH